MKTHGTSKANQASANEQQENVKNSRKTFGILQEVAHDKENLVGRPIIEKNIKLAGNTTISDTKPKILLHKAIQTGEAQITERDLTTEEEPTADYWRLLAETRAKSLDESFHKIEQLEGHVEHLEEHVTALEEENRICKEMLNESRSLVEVLEEIIGDETADGNGADEEA